jgi:hypothetical protein
MIQFSTFVKESKEENFIQLIISKRFEDILRSIHGKGNPIATTMLEDSKSEKKFDISFIDVMDKEDMLSYVTGHKAKQVLDKYTTINRIQDGYDFCWLNNRQEQRLTRLIPRLYGSKFGQKEIEDFVHEYKAALKADHSFDKFEIVEGEDVKKYYNEKYSSYAAAGSLQRSCMKYDRCKQFFELYTKNPTKMKMLILKQEDGVIYGRANLWYLDEPDGRVFMDRVYTTYDWQMKLFIDYAIKNKYIYKSRQIYGGSVIPVVKDGVKEKLIMTVNLKPHYYDYYPYVDTLQFYNKETGELTNDIEKFKDKKFVALVNAGGGTWQEGHGGFEIDNLGRIVHQQMVVYSDMDKVFIHHENAVNLKYRAEIKGSRHYYVTQDHEFVNVKGNVYLKSDMDWDEDKKEWTLKKNINI